MVSAYKESRVMRIGVLGFILSMPMLASAYFYQLDILKNSHEVIKALSDYHDKDHPITAVQGNYIKNYFLSCPKDTTKVIIEDLHSLMQDSAPQGILAGLAEYCSNCSLCVQNVEYRVLRVKALGEFVYQPDKNPFECKSACSITMRDLIAEIETAISALSGVSFPNPLVVTVQKIIAETRKNIVNFKWHEYAHATVSEYLASIPLKQRYSLIKKMLMCDVKLLDLHILAAIISQPHYQNIIICAGGSHIQQIGQLLKKIGYHSHFSTKTSFFTETDLSRCVTATIYHNSYCLKPHPVNLNLLHHK